MSTKKKKIIIEVEKTKKKRVPVPKKPPKIIDGKKVYNRKKEKDKTRKSKGSG